MEILNDDDQTHTCTYNTNATTVKGLLLCLPAGEGRLVQLLRLNYYNNGREESECAAHEQLSMRSNNRHLAALQRNWTNSTSTLRKTVSCYVAALTAWCDIIRWMKPYSTHTITPNNTHTHINAKEHYEKCMKKTGSRIFSYCAYCAHIVLSGGNKVTRRYDATATVYVH